MTELDPILPRSQGKVASKAEGVITIPETEGSILIDWAGVRTTGNDDGVWHLCCFWVEEGRSWKLANFQLVAYNFLATSRRSARSRSRFIVRLKSPLA